MPRPKGTSFSDVVVFQEEVRAEKTIAASNTMSGNAATERHQQELAAATLAERAAAFRTMPDRPSRVRNGKPR
jgi:hypothetical protein